MNRGRNRKRIFVDDEDAVEFLDVVGETVERYGVEVHAYSLMPNHYHLLVRSPLGNLSPAMKHLGAVYTQRFNNRHQKDSSLFRGRFKSQLVKYEAYLLYLLAYIHLNPLRAGLITRLDGLEGWTSHRRYVGKESAPEWLSTNVLGSQFDGTKELKEYILGLHRKREPWPAGMNLKDGWFRWHLCPVDLEQPEESPGDNAVDVASFIEDICRVTNVEASRLRQSIRGPGGNPERGFAVWAFTKSSYLRYREIGGHLGMTFEHVARDVRRSRANIEKFGDWVDAWTELYPSKMSIV